MLLPLFLMSCLNKDNNIVSLLKEWEQKEILFPKEMYFTTMLRDTTYYNLQSEYKILAYVDSIGCTSCKLQLSAWSMLINEIDSLYAGRVKFIFAFSPNRIKDIYHAILTANFTYPVYVDKQDSIAKLNRFPLESNLHTFLLDKNNRVIADCELSDRTRAIILAGGLLLVRNLFYRVMQNKEQMLVWINDF